VHVPFPPALARAFARALGGDRAVRIADDLAFEDAGHGYDAFGMHPDFVGLGDALGGWLHDHWFRVTAYDAHHIPADGPAILAANHSGTLPFDGVMLWANVLRSTNPPRAPRPVADYFVSTLPFVSTLFARAGVIGGARGNVRRLLEQGDLLMLFPEGEPGIGKPFSERYRLQTWRKGHCEMAIRYRAPVVPVGIVGAEEQMPQLGRIPLRKLGLAVPFLPIPATPVPLPVHYHVVYGEPLRFDREFSPAQADDPQIVSEAASRVKQAVLALIHRGLRERRGVFA
jgi:1-acyl-sn-glycerol-3-phosphate acyltransferase